MRSGSARARCPLARSAEIPDVGGRDHSSPSSSRPLTWVTGVGRVSAMWSERETSATTIARTSDGTTEWSSHPTGEFALGPSWRLSSRDARSKGDLHGIESRVRCLVGGDANGAVSPSASAATALRATATTTRRRAGDHPPGDVLARASAPRAGLCRITTCARVIVVGRSRRGATAAAPTDTGAEHDEVAEGECDAKVPVRGIAGLCRREWQKEERSGTCADRHEWERRAVSERPRLEDRSHCPRDRHQREQHAGDEHFRPAARIGCTNQDTDAGHPEQQTDHFRR